jgi:hypothetical protein
MNLLVLARVFHLPGIIQRLVELSWALTCKNGAKWLDRVYYSPVNYTKGDVVHDFLRRLYLKSGRVNW